VAYVYDTSAILAMVAGEPGDEVAFSLAHEAVVSAVNYAEVVTKVVEWGYPDGFAEDLFKVMNIDIVQFDADQATYTGILRVKTRSKGLSLGDRACLSLAHTLGATALTADRAWADLDVGVPVQLIR
jgi:ribonuclease VapC